MTEEVLPAVNRYNPWGFWQPFAFDTHNGPSDVRSKLVHEGWSEVDAAHSCDLQDYCSRLDRLFKELVERILDRRWAQSTRQLRNSDGISGDASGCSRSKNDAIGVFSTV